LSNGEFMKAPTVFIVVLLAGGSLLAETPQKVAIGLKVVSLDAARKAQTDGNPIQFPATLSVGVFVTNVDEAGACAKAGIKKNDVITRIGSSPMRDADSFERWLSTARTGEVDEVSLMRLDAQGNWAWREASVTTEATQRETPVTAEGPQSPSRQRWDRQTAIVTSTPHGSIYVGVKSTIIYLPSGTTTAREFAEVHFKENGSAYQKPSGHFYSIAGKPAEIKVTSSNDEIAIDDDSFGYNFEFKQVGDSGFDVMIDGRLVHFPLKIVKSPVGEGASADDVIKDVGLPSQKEQHSVSWPDSGLWDNILYDPGPEAPALPEHWRFDRYPNLVVAVEGGRVIGISSYDKSADTDFEKFLDWSK
jgi:hypothetical protein